MLLIWTPSCAREPALMDENAQSGKRMIVSSDKVLFVPPDDYLEARFAVANSIYQIPTDIFMTEL
jgi:hypothetical protein